MRLSVCIAGFIVIGLFSVAAIPALAQKTADPKEPHARDIPACHKGNFELGLFGGESYGLDRFRPMGGGNIAYGLSCALFPFAEGSYLPGVLRTNNTASTNTASYRQFNVNMTDFHAGLHLRFPRPEWRVVPYGVLGVGLLHGSESTGILYNVSAIGQVDKQTQILPSSTNFAFNFGGGLRFFLNERFAIRVEFKGFKPVSAPTPLDPRMFYRFAIGPVFQLK